MPSLAVSYRYNSYAKSETLHFKEVLVFSVAVLMLLLFYYEQNAFIKNQKKN